MVSLRQGYYFILQTSVVGALGYPLNTRGHDAKGSSFPNLSIGNPYNRISSTGEKPYYANLGSGKKLRTDFHPFRVKARFHYRRFGLNKTTQITILTSMPFNPRRVLTHLSLIVYATSLLLVVSPHGDAQSATGSGKTSIRSHADAARCKHIDASHAETCFFCSLFAGRVQLASSPVTVEVSLKTLTTYGEALFSSHSLQVLVSIYRRGPPPLLPNWS